MLRANCGELVAQSPAGSEEFAVCNRWENFVVEELQITNEQTLA